MIDTKAKDQRQVVIYTRSSQGRNTKETVSCDTQIEYCCNFAKFRKLTVLADYRDEDMSGAKAENRPGLQAALSHACQKKAILLVFNMSRLAHSTKETVQIAKRLKEAGADFASIDDKINTTLDKGRFFFGVMAAMAKLERVHISERTSEAMLSHQASGKLMGSVPPYGYMIDPKDGNQLIPNSYESKVIKRVLQLHNDQGLSLRNICAKLTEEGYNPRRRKVIVEGKETFVNKDWSHSTVKKILDREAIATA
jgi:DNA invertase Pin-like site-specific DNA recombinase